MYWESSLTTSIDNFTEEKPEEVIPVIDTVEAENPIAKLVEELSLNGESRMSIVMAAMRKFPEREFTLAQWTQEVTSYLDSLEQDDSSDVPTNLIVAESDANDDERPENKISQKRKKPRIKIRSITIDGTVIEESNPTQMFIDFINTVGADIVFEMQIPYLKSVLVDNKQHVGYETASKPVGNGYYLNTCSSTGKKIEQMQDIADYFSLNLQIDRYLISYE